MLKNYRVESEEVEIVHYLIVRDVEATSEEDARERVKKGEGFVIDSESFDYRELTPAKARMYADGELSIVLISKVELSPTQKEIDNQKLINKRKILEKQIEDINKQIID